MHNFRQLLRIARILSLDVVIGACICMLFIASYLSVQVTYFQVAALGISVWLIYTADHLLDSYQLKHPAHSRRHLFHQKYFKGIAVTFCLVALLGLWVLTNLSERIIVMGLILVVLVGIYFFLISVFKPEQFFHKEFMISFLYTSGIFLAPVSQMQSPLSADIYILFFQFLMIALVNLMEFSFFEKKLDEQDHYKSFTTLYGENITKRLIYGLFILLLISVASSFLFIPISSKLLMAESLIFLMGITLFAILLKPRFFQKNEYYRIVGDFVFLYPLFFILI